MTHKINTFFIGHFPFLWVFAIVFFFYFLAPLVHAQCLSLPPSCQEKKAFLNKKPLPPLSLPTPSAHYPTPSLHWAQLSLPVDEDHPQTPSSAYLKLSVYWSSSENHYFLKITFSFPSPNAPYGIPYSFYWLSISFLEGPLPYTIHVPLAPSCQNTGRSLFPQQSWSTQIPLPFGIKKIKSPTLWLWGTRN